MRAKFIDILPIFIGCIGCIGEEEKLVAVVD
jgi:hypothetical protein